MPIESTWTLQVRILNRDTAGRTLQNVPPVKHAMQPLIIFVASIWGIACHNFCPHGMHLALHYPPPRYGGECRWNYILDKDEVVGSSPTCSTPTFGGAATQRLRGSSSAVRARNTFHHFCHRRQQCPRNARRSTGRGALPHAESSRFEPGQPKDCGRINTSCKLSSAGTTLTRGKCR